MTLSVCKTPLIQDGEAEKKRQEIRDYYIKTWELYENLFGLLASDEAYYQRPESLRHPLIFYYGHTAVFFTNKLVVSGNLDRRIDDRVESMMAIGVDEMSWDDLDERNYDWPTVAEVQAYRDKVRETVLHCIDTLPLSLPIDWHSPFWIILMGIEHERIHLETSSVLMRQLPLDYINPLPQWSHCTDTGPAPENRLQSVEGATIELGRDHDQSHTYGWDNEYGYQKTEVDDFRASRYLVSNGEFLEFVKDGGYREQRWWTDEGWRWREYRQAEHPTFWVLREDGSYAYRALTAEIDMPWNWPVDVNYLEAKAFCNWLSARTGKTLRLPTEPEWYCLHRREEIAEHTAWRHAPGNINLEHYASSCPVDRFMQGDFGDVIGNVWQWTETAIDGFDGFRVHPAYDDFSVPTFDGQHNLIKGGSWISTGNESLLESRYAFRRHFFQHAGFRYVESDAPVVQTTNPYEMDTQISMYLEFHYGEPHFGVPNYPRACIDTLLERIERKHFERVLDLGCAVGRSSFELARVADHVDAIDFSTRFIRNALSLREHGSLRYSVADEGDICSLHSIDLDALGIGEGAERIEFMQGDACNLKDKYTDYDLVFAGNLIDRLYDPRRFLRSMIDRIRPGGYLVLTSPYTWLEEFTERDQWLGGYKRNGENVTTLEGIAETLEGHFELQGETQDIPFVIRETRRKFQHTIAEMSIWRKQN